MALNKAGDKPLDLNRGKLSRINAKERHQVRLNCHNSQVTNIAAKEKTNPGSGNTFIIPELLCQCQQKCTERVTAPLIQKISMYSFGMRHDKAKHYKYLADLILSKEKKFDLVDIVPGKRLRKMSFRYFVPILTDKDLKSQVDEKTTHKECTNAGNANGTQQNGVQEEKIRDHIEVCLKAFITVHLISEKRVNITRSTCKLKNNVYCTRPFAIYSANSTTSAVTNAKPIIANKIKSTNQSTTFIEKVSAAGPSDVSLAAAAWLSNHCQQSKPAYAINPRTLLPEGLVLPDSVTCLPVYPKQQYDPSRDAMIVDSFFINQLWKPEYTGGLQEN